MKASDMIKQLEGLIKEYGDLPIAMTEVKGCGVGVYVEVDGIEGVYDLEDTEVFYDCNDMKSGERKLFIID